MKKIALISVKTLLAFLFLYNIGLFSLFNNISNIGETPPPPIKADGGRKDLIFLQEKVKHAKLLGPAYGPEEYFADLTAIRLKQKHNDFDRCAVLSVSSSIFSLLDIFDRNIKDARRDMSEQEYKRFMLKLSEARDKSQEAVNPGQMQQHQKFRARYQADGFWWSVIVDILTWLFGFYWKNMPLAFMLLWIWWYQDKNRVSINNPLSFLICLFLYPIVIGRAWHKILKEGKRSLAMQIEFKRRQSDIFSLISKDELKIIHRFAQSHTGVRDYQHELNDRRLTRHHALIPFLLVTIVLMVSNETLLATSSGTTSTSVEITVNMPPGISPHHYQVNDTTSWSTLGLTEELIMTIPYLLAISKITRLTPKLLKGYKRKLKPVPLLPINLQYQTGFNLKP